MNSFRVSPRHSLAPLLALASLLSACSLTPVLERPQVPLPARYDNVSAHHPANTAALGWQTMFGDPRLQALITLALQHNSNLRLAVLNVQAVRAQFDVQDSARLPSVTAQAGSVRQRSSDNNSSSGAGTVEHQHTLGLAINAYELDLFGRVAAQSEAAQARYLASDANRRAVQIAVVAAVADAYFAQRLADEQLQLTEHTLADWQRSLELAQQLHAAQQRSGLDVAEAEGQVASALADRAARQRAVALAGNALALLTGVTVPSAPPLPAALALDQQPVRVHLPAGLPSELLTRRPDIAQAEQVLIAAKADIGAARAAFFPQISLTTSLGYASPSLSSLFGSNGRVWSFAPQISVPLFNHGKLRAELRIAELRQASAVAEYEKVVQTAFREVADGLAGSATYTTQISAQTLVVASAARRLTLARLRYDAGQESRLTLLDAQRQLYAAQLSLLELRRNEFGNAVALYQALGGGLAQD